MANNKFDIKVFTDELNKAFTILKKEQVLEKYMKNVLLNYNSIIYIGNITDEPNIYNTIYNYMYGEDNTLCNIVVFETDGFVDSESNIIPSGIHIAYPYLDYDVCIDYKYILNINNSAELLTPTQEFKTINNESILGTGNIAVQEPLVSGTNIKTVNEQTMLGNGNIPVQEPLVSGTNIKTVNGNSLLGSGNIELSNDTVVIDIGTISEEGGTIASDILSKINNAISENKNITIKANESEAVSYIFPNIVYLAGSVLYAVSVLSDGSFMEYLAIVIELSSGQYTLNFLNVQEPLVSGKNIKTINNKSILGSGNLEINDSDTIIIDLGTLSESGTLSSEIIAQINNNLNSKSIIFKGTFNDDFKSPFTTSDYTVLTTSGITVIGITFLFGTSVNIISITLPSGSYTHTSTIWLDETNTKTINNQSLLGAGNISVQEPLVSGTNIKTVEGQSILGSGNIEINNTIKIIECSPGAKLNTDTLQKLQSGKYALYITGTMFYPTSEPKRFNTVPYFNYFGTSIQMGYKSVAINQANYLETISTYLIDLDIKKTS